MKKLKNIFSLNNPFLTAIALAGIFFVELASANSITDQVIKAYRARESIGLIRGASVAVVSPSGIQPFALGE